VSGSGGRCVCAAQRGARQPGRAHINMTWWPGATAPGAPPGRREHTPRVAPCTTRAPHTHHTTRHHRATGTTAATSSSTSASCCVSAARSTCLA
jgi:hypothetical protein